MILVHPHIFIPEGALLTTRSTLDDDSLTGVQWKLSKNQLKFLPEEHVSWW